MSYGRNPWKLFEYSLDKFEDCMKRVEYAGAFSPPLDDPKASRELSQIPEGAIGISHVRQILSYEALGQCHGLELLEPIPVPSVPKFPARPDIPRPGLAHSTHSFFQNDPKSLAILIEIERVAAERPDKLEQRRAALVDQFARAFEEECKALAALRDACLKSDVGAIASLMKISLIRHPLARPLMRETSFQFDLHARIALADIEIPDFASLSILKKRGDSRKAKYLPVPLSERGRSLEAILHGLCIRAAYLVARSDVGNWFDVIAVNARQKWHDSATGAPKEGVIASLQALKTDLVALQVGQLEAKACFRHLKGLVTPSLEQVSAIKPIFVMDTADGRVVKNRDVAEEMAQEANLAAMPWDDFEHLVRQLFEWEFGRNGVQVVVTRASRDRGVDAIMFDPDPLRGGKYVLQAKRYTRPVDVAAVRDLYGTVMNEGANRGILVTTSSFGPDSYEFAKGKPISLVDGAHLVAMFKRHGRGFRVDLAEARGFPDMSR